jgi:mono/diheme cytochrome c family protein
MNFLKIGFVFTAALLFIIACNQTNNVNTNLTTVKNTASNATLFQPEATPETIDDLASARKIYSEKCVNCHKENGSGGVTVLDDGTKIKAPNFMSERLKKDADDDWIETIENGAKEDGMPAFKGKITDDEIKNLVKYIRREFQGK